MNWKIEALNETNISEMLQAAQGTAFSPRERDQLQNDPYENLFDRYRLVSESGRDWFLHTISMMMTKYYVLFYQGEVFKFYLNNGSFENGFAATPELRSTNQDVALLQSVLIEVFAIYGEKGVWEIQWEGKLSNYA